VIPDKIRGLQRLQQTQVASADSDVSSSTMAKIEDTHSEFGRAARRKAEPRQELLAEDAREQCGQLARRARDAFKEACESDEPDQAESCYAAAVDAIKELWSLAPLRDQPFRDLLAALDAALRHGSITDFNTTQRNVIRSAFTDLPRWLLDEGAVADHLARFVEQDISVLGPIVPRANKRLRITIEELD
jgi:hypothetical protein